MMKLKKHVFFMCLAAGGLLLLAGCSKNEKKSGSPVTVNLVTAGDTNMEELFNKQVAGIAAEKIDGLKLNVVGSGPGDSGSRKIYDKLIAQKQAGKKTWDIDIAIVHQGIMKELIGNGLLEKYVPSTNCGPVLTSDGAKNSLGTDVDGYVIPLFLSQTAIAYNSKNVQKVPGTMNEVKAWIQAHPQKFGYNGVKNGMSGVAFVAGWLYNETGNMNQITKGPYDKSIESGWGQIAGDLKKLPVTYTNGNQGTLDMLNRGEIDMGPVWVDMFYSMQAQGRMSSDVRLTIPSPGLPGQPMYIVVTSQGGNKAAAIKLAELLASPEIQASVIVNQYNWYPGIDSSKVLPLCSKEAQNSLFHDITPDILSQYGKVLPLNEFKNDMMEIYESSK